MSTFHVAFSLFFAVLVVTASAGPAYPACVLACELACTGTAIVPVALPAYLLCAQTCPGACLVSCFSEDTMVIAKDCQLDDCSESSFRSIAEVKAGDEIFVGSFSSSSSSFSSFSSFSSSSSNDSIGWSEVTSNRRLAAEDTYEFVSIRTGRSEMTLTPEHVVVLSRPGRGLVALAASKISTGDLLLNQHGREEIVVDVERGIRKESKYELITRAGFMVVYDGGSEERQSRDGIIVSTICDEYLVREQEADWQTVLMKWQTDHL